MQLILVPNFKGNLASDRKESGIEEHKFSWQIESPTIPRPGDYITLANYTIPTVKSIENQINSFLTEQNMEANFKLMDYTLVGKVHFAFDIENHEKHKYFVLLEYNAKPSNRIGFR